MLYYFLCIDNLDTVYTTVYYMAHTRTLAKSNRHTHTHKHSRLTGLAGLCPAEASMLRSSRTLVSLKKAKMKIFFSGPKMETRRRCVLWCVFACVLSSVFARSLQARIWNRKPFNWGFGRALGSQDFLVSCSDLLESKISSRDVQFNFIHYRLFALRQS